MSRKKSAKDQTISVAEFKQWLSGVEDMQQNGWVPNDEQWKKIRSKIASLSDDIYEEAIQGTPVQYQPEQMYIPQPPVYLQPQQQHHQPSYGQAPRQPQGSLGDELFIPSAANDLGLDSAITPGGVTQFG